MLDRLFAAQRQSQPTHSGARLIAPGTEAFALRALSARAAVRCLDLQYYIWHSDATGRYLAHEVLRAADRGVRVRVLIDDMDARSRDAVLMALDQHPLVDIRVFNPFTVRSGILLTARELLLRGSRLNHRMHNKAWIADGRIALVGGRNIGDEYFAASKQVNFVDLDVLLAGPAVAQATHIFDRYWNSESAVPITRLRRTRRDRQSLEEVRGLLGAAAWTQESSEYVRRLRETPQLHDLIDRHYELVWSDGVEVIADDPRKALKRRPEDIDPGVLQSISSAFERARCDLRLISPYFVPGAGGAAQLKRKAGDGCVVAVLTNSLAATDVAAVHGGYAKYRRPLLEAGVQLFELKPAPEEDEGKEGEERRSPRLRLGSSRASLHTKAAIVDRERVFVGSFNLDPRSATLNCEMGVWIADAAVAQQMQEMFAFGATPQHSFVLSLDERGRLRWTESVARQAIVHRRDPHASWARRCVTWLLRHLPIESQL
ncbi:MAG TPA: phospholipase D family protein [Povalibacter sp.]|uniref:phospholipase D family protein n=1 Tax=Povalibacter sp. TaxID=1962978 RepID=UPI002CAD7B57|nr:phospholipase D family protein [Povalibacter sp.]HMN45794.1 phospholipase D family protein [Povalibacter sp.]